MQREEKLENNPLPTCLVRRSTVGQYLFQWTLKSYYIYLYVCRELVKHRILIQYKWLTRHMIRAPGYSAKIFNPINKVDYLICLSNTDAFIYIQYWHIGNTSVVCGVKSTAKLIYRSYFCNIAEVVLWFLFW